ncbi:MAG: mycofactocin radical SAM maturase [Actinobacteria bacterium]|nr:mycofactocin radical SAM maturase [Actinomycetota bacterium]
MRVDETWRLRDSVALRPEAFGALAYDFSTRTLTFLKTPALLDVVRRLGSSPTVGHALADAGVPPARSGAYMGALATLASSGLLGRRDDNMRERADRSAAAGTRSSSSSDTGRPTPPAARATTGGQPPAVGSLVERFEYGLDAPICLTWELTYACNLACVHCLSSSGRRDPDELSTVECKRLIDEFERMQIFYVNVGGGEPTVRSDFWDLLDYAVAHRVGVKFSTNGFRITPERARQLAATDYVDVQVSLDGATATVNDPIRGPGTYAAALAALEHLATAGMRDVKLSVVCTRHNLGQLDAFKAIADRYGAQLRLTRLRPSGRGADVWDQLHPLPEQQRELYEWLLAHGDDVGTGDSFFHLSAYGRSLPGLNLCGAGRVVCLVDPVGDVYACPFAIHDRFRAGNVRADGGFEAVWRTSSLFEDLRSPQTGGACTRCSAFDACRGGCMAAKFFTGLPLDGPDPECVKGKAQGALATVDRATLPTASGDHSHRGGVRRQPVVVPLSRRPVDKACDEHPLAASVGDRFGHPG